MKRVVATAQELVGDFASRKRLAGQVGRQLPRRGRSRLRASSRSSASSSAIPGTARTSRMAATFDQIYYGGSSSRRSTGSAGESGTTKG